MKKRREFLNLTKNDHVIGCPLCNVLPEEELMKEATAATGAGGQ